MLRRDYLDRGAGELSQRICLRRNKNAMLSLLCTARCPEEFVKFVAVASVRVESALNACRSTSPSGRSTAPNSI
jgi:hypothetical protein